MPVTPPIPASETVGLKDDYNGPICYTPDGNPLVGPAPGLRHIWLPGGALLPAPAPPGRRPGPPPEAPRARASMWRAEGSAWRTAAAGATGHYLAQMMVDGEAEIDMAALDPKRFGS